MLHFLPTVNPGYAGRSNLPDNLKKLFRSMAMTRPDRELIAQVMLFSQGFRNAETLASKIVPFFNLCAEQLSSQPHYDFGLRALKSVLVSAGHLKRERLQATFEKVTASENSPEAIGISEQEILIQSVTETIVPKLVADDVPLLTRYVSLFWACISLNSLSPVEVFSPTSSLASLTFRSILTNSRSTSLPFVQSVISTLTPFGFRKSCSFIRFKTFSMV